jgi:dihydroorotase-like cyclic amidohydrolase
MARRGPFAKIGPPLRPADGPDRAALWQGAADGTIATVGSDHAPRAPRAKQPGWRSIFVDPEGRPVPFGAPSVETLGPRLYSEGVVQRGRSPTWLARVRAENSARIVGLSPRKGAIRVGADADLLLSDPAATGVIRAADHRRVAGSTRDESWAVRGRPRMTLLRGQVLLEDGRLRQAPDSGRDLVRSGPVPPLGGAGA